MARVLGVGPGVFVLAFFLYAFAWCQEDSQAGQEAQGLTLRCFCRVLFIVIVVAFSKTSMSGCDALLRAPCSVVTRLHATARKASNAATN